MGAPGNKYANSPLSEKFEGTSVSIFGLIVYVFVKNYIKNKIDQLIEDEKNKKLK